MRCVCGCENASRNAHTCCKNHSACVSWQPRFEKPLFRSVSQTSPIQPHLVDRQKRMFDDQPLAYAVAGLEPGSPAAAALAALAELADSWALPEPLPGAVAIQLCAQFQLPCTAFSRSRAAQLLADELARLSPARPTLLPSLGRTSLYGRWLRELFLHAYQGSKAPLASLVLHLVTCRACDAPSADPHARARLARESEAVFLHLAELFGLWAARDELAHRAQQILYPGPFNVAFRELETSRRLRAEQFADLAALLAPACAAGSGTTLRLVTRSPASVLRRERAGEERDRIFGTLKLDARAPDLDTLAAFREQAAILLADRFALPHHPALAWNEQRRFNGYHAWVLVAGNGDAYTPFLRLLATTPAMEAGNSFGILASSLHSGASVDHAWWNAPAPPALLDPSEGAVSVFSRNGEIVTLPNNSTVLDFACRVRSDLLDHCSRVWVNGEPASLSRRLAPGDVVEIETDRRFRGPLPSWEFAAFLPENRHRIRRALSQHADHAEQGRQLLAAAITARCLAHALPTPTEQALHQLLVQVARRFNFVGVEPLCVALCTPELRNRQHTPTLAQVANVYIANRLGALLACADGTPVARRYARLQVVAHDPKQNPPVRPGAPVAGRLRNAGTAHEELVLVPAPPPGTPLPPNLVPLVWRPAHAQGSTYVITIDTLDRHGLLGDLLSLVYAHDDGAFHLRQVFADAEQDAFARIVLSVVSTEPGQLDTLRARLATLAPEDRLRVVVEQEQAGHEPPLFDTVPYTTNPVSHPGLFLGRELEVKRIARTLASGANLVVVGGQSRIGKTSLLLWLANQELPLRQMRPALVHLGSCNFTARGFWRAVVEALHESFQRYHTQGMTLARFQLDDDDPYAAAAQAVEQLARDAARQRVVLLVDEFTALHESWPQPEAALVASQLSALLARMPYLSALLVAHDPLFAAGKVAVPIARLLQQGVFVRLDHLEHEAARRLVVKPVEHLIAYDEALVAELVRLTDGHPYLLQYTLMALHARVNWQGLQHARLADLDAVVAELLDIGRHLFRHHRELIPTASAPVAWAVARLTRGNSSCSRTAVSAELGRAGRPVSSRTLTRHIATLQDAGILAVGDDNLHLRIPLFARWIATLATPERLT